MKKELILIGLVAVNSYLINSSEAATNDSEVNIAINEFNSQDYTENILDNEIQGYNFMAENALNSNDALKQELLIQIDEATKIGDIALAKTLRDYYNNLTMPYVVSNYDDNVSISLPSDESIFNEIQADLEELQNNNSNNTQSK
ncbi:MULTISPECIES: hypothetical protein [Megamonas]|uniref:Uncharacterized protein n=1 Tax=Megamonas funiformis YIT 11815 TaxID=742816 RepID=A0ABP2NMC9_9FIRM|nr:MULTISPECIES: hypothetical protein [Megamonas]EHR38903.1 hypothetical protein HMPREF9454_00353 [Megamonas funiformis YIT 11815]MBS5781054.1 hypothetical protein [Megamonas sp.]QIB60304.1 hypothetical protein GXM21_07835 [Megamonas funiformis]RHG10330.1 hypothetical protein DW639_04540 [Megamonas funiformis]UBS48709.1 hypothetical protein LCQ45_11335 [Megamonas funiformis]